MSYLTRESFSGLETTAPMIMGFCRLPKISCSISGTRANCYVVRLMNAFPKCFRRRSRKDFVGVAGTAPGGVSYEARPRKNQEGGAWGGTEIGTASSGLARR